MLQSRAEDDPVGIETLERLAAAAPRYNAWLIERVLPWVGRRVLEIGAGVGTMSAFLADRERVVLSDTNAGYLERLRARFAGHPHIRVETLRLPATEGDLQAERLDTIICLNVLEHVRDDELSLATMFQLLQPGGRLVLLVPSLPAIYGTLDRALGHFRRYTRAELRRKYAVAGFRMRHLEYFNMAGIPGWWFTGRVLRRELIPTGSLRWYDALVPLFRLERFLPWRLGQSLIAVGERPA
ncbi:MAG TPA: class I SAM-dependent methyltransferase [Gemmatimonadales bacterium]|nr:class I SAM-dependent methyltransferase [Gemmatimonadales bacterium]